MLGLLLWQGNKLQNLLVELVLKTSWVFLLPSKLLQPLAIRFAFGLWRGSLRFSIVVRKLAEKINKIKCYRVFAVTRVRQKLNTPESLSWRLFWYFLYNIINIYVPLKTHITQICEYVVIGPSKWYLFLKWFCPKTYKLKVPRCSIL